MISYEDFDLRILPDGNGFNVHARRGSQSATEPFELDLSLSWDLWELNKRGQTRERGFALFDALIRGRVRDLYQQGRGRASDDFAKGLRIRILLDPRDERLHPLVRLPWELLCDRSADTGHHLALDPRRPIVRTIDSFEQPLAPIAGRLERVLLVLSNPLGTVALDLERECASVEEALGRIAIRPEILKHATRASLLEKIRDDTPQIVHFIGHGTFDETSGQGLLLLENEHSRKDTLQASMFAGFFTGQPMPRLVILTSCLSAEPGPREPFAGVAAALVAAGLPAVIAMQAEVRDKSAIRFSERLYRRLVDGDPIEAAVSSARIALHAGRIEAVDWAAPVLFVRGEGGGSLEEAPRPEPQQSAEQSPPPTSVVTAQTIEILTVGNVNGIYQIRNKP
jgi:CHAT domain